MTEQYPQIFTMIPDEEFFDRESELERIYNYALSIPKKLASSLILTGRRGIGKTELLKRIYNRLFWKQDTVIPFYYSMNRDYLSVQEFSRDYLSEFIKQYIGFTQKDHTLVNVKNLPFKKLLKLAYQADNKYIVDLIDNFLEASKDNDFLSLVRNSISAPLYIALNENIYVFPILDEFQYVSNIHLNNEPYPVAGHYQILLQSHITPHLITGSSIRSIENIYKDTFFLSGLEKFDLSTFDKENAMKMFEGLIKRFKIKTTQDISADVVEQLGYNPFYIRSLLRSSKINKRAILKLRDFQDVYTSEVIEGNINYYWQSILNSSIKNINSRRLAMEILNILSNSPGLCFSINFLSKRLFVQENDVQEILTILDKAGLIDCKYDNARIVQDTVLTDSIKSIYAIEVKADSKEKVKNQLIGNKLKYLSLARKSQFKNELIGSLEILLKKFDCQKIPLSLFDYQRYYSNYESTLSTPITEILEREKDRISLPQIIGSFREIQKDAYGLPSTYIVAYGFERGIYISGNEVLWVIESLENTATITVKDIITFEKNILTIAKNLDINKVLKWIIGKDVFDKSALELARQHNILCSNLHQLNKLIELFIGVGEYIYKLEGGPKSPDSLFKNFKTKKSVPDNIPEVADENIINLYSSTDLDIDTSLLTNKNILSESTPDTDEIDTTREGDEASAKEHKFEMTIPMEPEAELVAAKTAEAIAKNNNFDEEAIGHIRMAVIEACINAKEHSESKEKNFLLQFITDDTSMTIYVCNRGKKFTPDTKKSALGITDKIYTENKRGWGIKLMKNLMDAVDFEDIQNGTQLKMVKYKKSKKDNIINY